MVIGRATIRNIKRKAIYLVAEERGFFLKVCGSKEEVCGCNKIFMARRV